MNYSGDYSGGKIFTNDRRGHTRRKIPSASDVERADGAVPAGVGSAGGTFFCRKARSFAVSVFPDLDGLHHPMEMFSNSTLAACKPCSADFFNQYR